MASCPTDSVDCLLRAILGAQSGYNWNPPTFGATIVIGVLALAVAMTTVFQGALNAGPGRLKASQRAIGPKYYMESQTRFSWLELRFRTMTRVPFIDTIRWFDLVGTTERDSSRHFKKHHSYGAGWLNLINSIPMNCHYWKTTHCQTDYLPSDVQAAPARATIRAVVELAVLTACDSVMLVKDLPLVSGDGSQLSFRDHPYLGLVAVFDQYLLEDRRPPNDVRKCHTLYLDGHFSFQDLFMEALLFDGNHSPKFRLRSMSVMETLRKAASPLGELAPHEFHSVDAGLHPSTLKSISLGLMTWDSPDRCYDLPHSKLQIRASLLQLCQTSSSWTTQAEQEILYSIYALLQYRSNLLAYDKYRTLPTVLTEGSRQPKLGWTWLQSAPHKYSNRFGLADLRHGSFIDQDTRCHHEEKHGQRSLQGEHIWFDWRPNGPSDIAMAILPDDGNLALLPYTLELCVAWLKREDHFNELASEAKVSARVAIEHQLHEVDYWLLHQGSFESAAQVLAILGDFDKPISSSMPLAEGVIPSVPYSAHRQHHTSERVPVPRIEKSRTFSFERIRPPSLQQVRPDTDQQVFSSDSSLNLHERPAKDRPNRDRKMSKSTQSKRPLDNANDMQEHSLKTFDGEFLANDGQHGYLNYPRRQDPPSMRVTELRETSGTVLNATYRLPNATTLNHMLHPGSYRCEIDRCKFKFDLFHSLKAHCVKIHGYSELNWTLDSPYVKNSDEHFMCALEWYTNATGHLHGYMRRQSAVDQVFQEIIESMESDTRPVMTFQYHFEIAQWSLMTKLEQRKRKILDRYLLPPPLPQQSPIHHDYLICVFEIQKLTALIETDREWPDILRRTRASLHENNDQQLNTEGSRDQEMKSEQGSSFETKSDPEEDANEGSISHSRGANVLPGPGDLTRLASTDTFGESPGEVVRNEDFRSVKESAIVERRTSQRSNSSISTSKASISRINLGEQGEHNEEIRIRGGREGVDRQRIRAEEELGVFPLAQKENGSLRQEPPGSIEASGAGSRETNEANIENSLVLHPKRRIVRERSLMDTGGDFTNPRHDEGQSTGALEVPSSVPRRSMEGHRLIPENLRLLPPEDRPSSMSSQIVRGKGSAADKGMRTVLVYRAVLFAALCALAADTSCVYETELGRRVVQVL